MKYKLKFTRRGKYFLAIFFLFGLMVTGDVLAKGNILINEIFPNPKGSDKGKEFVEFYNGTDGKIEVSDFVLKKTSKKGKIKMYKFKEDDAVEEGGYLVLKTTGLNNDGAEIELLNGDGVVIDSRKYSKVVEGKSYNCNEEDRTKEWYWGVVSSKEKNIENIRNKKYPKIIITEVLPNPKGDEKKNEFIELYNPNEGDVNLNEWQLRDASKTGKYVFSDDFVIKVGEYAVIYRKDFKFALNNSGKETVILLKPNGKVSNKVDYAGAKENFSYGYDLNIEQWNWGKLLTPGKENKFNHLPTFEVSTPRRVKVDELVELAVLDVRDGDGDEVSIFWDFGDGEKSSEEKAGHIYKKSGNYEVILRVDDGYEEVLKSFEIIVEENEKSEPTKVVELAIVKLIPNPAGVDKGREIIVIKNLGQEEINLKGYKIATGSSFDKIVNHPVYGDFIVKPNESKVLLNQEICKFNLPNKKGVIQIISNDKKLLDEVEYEKDKISDDEAYILVEEGIWQWQGGVKNLDEREDSVSDIDEKGDGDNDVDEDNRKEEEKEDNVVKKDLDKKYLKIIITEVLPNPKGDEKKNEFIELYNPNERDVNLNEWQLRDASKTGKYVFSDDFVIKVGEYAVIYRKDFKFALNNSGKETVVLLKPNGKVSDKLAYEKTKEGISYNFNFINGDWRLSKLLTPGKENLFNHQPTFEVKLPKRIYKKMYAEFEVDNLEDKDGDKLKVTWDFGDGHKSYLKKTKHKFKRTGKYKIKLTVDDGSEKVIREFKIKVKKYPKYKLEIVELMPNPEGKDYGKEYLVIKNNSKKKINLYNYKINTGSNRKKLTGHPFYKDFVIKPGRTKKLLTGKICKFSLLNKKGVVQIVYPNGKIADEVKYGGQIVSGKAKGVAENEVYKLGLAGQWNWQGGQSRPEGDRLGVYVLGDRTVFQDDVDITLNKEGKICGTGRQIRIDNWVSRLNEEKIMRKYFLGKGLLAGV